VVREEPHKQKPRSVFFASRLLGYGSVIARVTGGTFETFDKIAHPSCDAEFQGQLNGASVA
jgi:hypothetical protein